MSPRVLLSAAEAERELRIPASTTRSWARRKQLWPCGLDERHQPLYDRQHLIRLRDKLSDPANSVARE